LNFRIPYLALSGVFLLTVLLSESQEEFLVAGQVYFDFGKNSNNNSTYLIYDNMTAGVRVKYPSGWNVLEQLGNISGNSILVDFYNAGINGTIGYSENANVVVSRPGGYSVNPMGKSEIPDSRAIQPTTINPAVSTDAPISVEQLNEFTNATVKTLSKTLNNFTLIESDSTIISGLPAHKITYTVAGNQSVIQQTQAWTSKDDRWFVFSYSAEPSAYFNPRTAQNILESLLIR
jgi:hypothetical protein